MIGTSNLENTYVIFPIFSTVGAGLISFWSEGLSTALDEIKNDDQN